MSATKDFSHSSKRSKRLIRVLRGFFLQFFNPRQPKNPVLTLKRRGPTGAGEGSLLRTGRRGAAAPGRQPLGTPLTSPSSGSGLWQTR